MAMTAGGPSGGAMSEINVTPMIDVLLVLLIIFMVIVPVTPKGLEALVPQPPKDPAKQQPNNDRTIVVQILHVPNQKPQYKINENPVDHSQLESELTKIYANRAERVMFIKGDDEINFAYVADVIDIAKTANVDNIGIITPKIQEGH